MTINLKNYTTEVQADKSIGLIEKLLVDFGATSIVKEYDELKPLPGRKKAEVLGVEKKKLYPAYLYPSDKETLVKKYGSITKAVETLLPAPTKSL